MAHHGQHHGQHQGQHSSGTPYGGGAPDRSILGDISGIQQHAKHNAGDSGDDSLFGNALAMLQAKEGNLANEDVDEDHMVQAHKSFFGSGSSSSGPATSGGIGAASAMQALKMFNGGTSEGGSESTQQEFIGMAMGQASKLFDQKAANGEVADSADKQSAVQQAGEMALKMYMKSEMGGSSGGGLMSLASKFM